MRPEFVFQTLFLGLKKSLNQPPLRHPDIGNHGLCHGLTVDDGLHLDYGNLQGTRQPTNQGFVKYKKMLLWIEKQNDTANLNSLLLSDSILHSFNYSVLSLLLLSYLLFIIFFWKTVLLPSFSYLPLAFCWSQLFLVPFPCKYPWTSMMHSQISKHLKN